MSEQVKPIVTVTPQANTPALKAALEEAGYAVIVTSRPDEIRVLDVMPVGVSNDIARAAYGAIKTSAYDSTKKTFAEYVVRAMLARGALGGEDE